ncbi:MAG: hypothetical protein HOE80_02780 [Candidatus Magasanikbacteria bacterium]|jgi:hypothetical protein|nr:hypothetical protein [Candidatus Magasanikbacteria bacterium]MBT4071623.1 hypothetical protein [Candidatus Magasanikbacteria bacterium]
MSVQSKNNNLTDKDRELALELYEELGMDIEELLGEIRSVKKKILEEKNKKGIKKTLEDIISIQDS